MEMERLLLERLSLSEKMPAAGKYPWLIYYHGKGFKNQTFCTKSSPNSFKTDHQSIPKLHKNKVVSCSHEWLLLCDNENILRYSVWNPVTSESIDLPLLKSENKERFIIKRCVLSSSPSDSNCLILLFVSNNPLIIYCRPGDEEWAEFNYEESLESILQTKEESLEWLEELQEYILSKAVSCNGKIYTISPFGQLIKVNHFNNVLSLSLIDQVGPSYYHMHSNCVRSFLLESGEQLYKIFICVDDPKVNEETLFIEVDKFNFSTNAWEKVTTTNGRAFFLGSKYSVSCPTDSNLEEEAGSYIYFTNPKDGILYSYRMEDESIAEYLPCPDLPKPRHLSPIWIMPAADHDQWNIEEFEEDKQPLEGNIETEDDGLGEVEETSLLCDMPSELLALVAGKLSFVDYINFRCVNRLSASTIPMRTTNSFSPCLIFYERSKGFCSFVDSEMKAKYSFPIPETIKDYTIRYSKDGWLLMDRRTSVIAFNPLSKEIIQLPEAPDSCIAISSFIITSAPPSSSDYFAIGMAWLGSHVTVNIKGSEEEEWCDVELENDPSFKPCSNAPVFYQGCFYYMGKDGRLGVIELEVDGVVNWRVLDKPRKPCSHFSQIFLAGCGEDLLSVFFCRKGNKNWTRIFRLIRSESEEWAWAEVNTLGKYSLYINRSSAFATIAERCDLANRVYFPRFYRNSLVYYSLKTKKFHCLGSQDSLENLYSTRMPLCSAWIPITSPGVIRQGECGA